MTIEEELRQVNDYSDYNKVRELLQRVGLLNAHMPESEETRRIIKLAKEKGIL